VSLTVKELKEILEATPDHYLIVLSSDSEGNNYSPAYSTAICSYVPDTTWYGDILDEEYETEENRNALVIWPTN